MSEASPQYVRLPPSYVMREDFRNLPFNEEWLTIDGLPFGLVDWALEFLEPLDFVMGLRVVQPASTSEPKSRSFRVKREENGDVDIQYEIDDHTFFSLRANSAVVIRHGTPQLTMAKYMPFLKLMDVTSEQRFWHKIWERKIVHENVAPLIPATNGATVELIRDSCNRLAKQYQCKFDWLDHVFGHKADVKALLADTRTTSNDFMNMALKFWDLELNLKRNARDFTPAQKQAEFDGFGFKCKAIRARAAAQGLDLDGEERRLTFINPQSFSGPKTHE